MLSRCNFASWLPSNQVVANVASDQQYEQFARLLDQPLMLVQLFKEVIRIIATTRHADTGVPHAVSEYALLQ